MQPHLDHPECAFCGSIHKSIFCDLNGLDLEKLSAEKNCTIYKKGQIVFNSGGYPGGLYCVKEGKIKIYKTGDEGKDQILRLVKSGDLMGYRALLAGEKYEATAEVLEEAKLCFVPKATFLNLLKSNGGLSMEVMKLLSNELGVAEDRMTDLAQKPVRERVAEALLYMKETYGLENDGSTIGVVLSREDIANIVGTAKETLIRLLSEFKSDGIIKLEGKKISILNLPKLIKTANMFD